MNSVKLITKIQAKIATNRQRRKRIRNVSPTFVGQASSNSGRERLVVKYRSNKPVEQILRERFEKAGWTVRKHLTDPSFLVPNLAERRVAFSVRDEQDQVKSYSGVLRPVGRAASALFRLDGSEEVFNFNYTGFMAVETV